MRLVPFVLLGALAAASGCSGAHETKHDRVVAAATPLLDTPRLDVPRLLKLTVDEMRQQVGPALPVPATFQDPTLVPQQNEPLDSTVLFQYRGMDIVASFDYRTRHVSDLLLLGSNEDELMNRGQLRLGSAQYLVLPVFQQRHPTKLLGLRVLATP